MYILNVSYSQQPSAVQAHVASHSAWVKQHLDEGNFLFAGPKKSGLGGVILTQSMAKASLLELLAKDSYVLADVVEYQIIEFDCKLAASGLERLLTD